MKNKKTVLSVYMNDEVKRKLKKKASSLLRSASRHAEYLIERDVK
jgi:predicted transcriptional regulator